MKLNYYLKDELKHVEVNQPCPGCGKIDQLAVHDKVTSYMRKIIDYFIGCNCGWCGPVAKVPDEAATLWDMRFTYV